MLKKDKKAFDLYKKEAKRQRETIDLIASENVMSSSVLEALSSNLANKYSEGYPGKRYYPGNEVVDEVEKLAQARALRMFDLDEKKWGVNVQPYSGSPANLAIYLALINPGEKIMGLELASGGHLTHGHKVSATGILFKAVQYGVDKDGRLDYKEIEALAKKEKPKIIVSGTTAYAREIDFKKFSEIAKKVGAYQVADISHIAGLVAAGLHKSPFPYADVVMSTTHKTLRGPRGAVIFGKVELMDKINKAVFPGIQGGPHGNVMLAKAVAFQEAAQKSFVSYQKQVVKNAKQLSLSLIDLGFNLVTGGTDNHLMLVDVTNFNIDGALAENRLSRVGILANRNAVPGDDKPFKPSGIRMGTPTVTSLGMKEKEMKEIAEIIALALANRERVDILKKRVLNLIKKFTLLNNFKF